MHDFANKGGIHFYSYILHSETALWANGTFCEVSQLVHQNAVSLTSKFYNNSSTKRQISFLSTSTHREHC